MVMINDTQDSNILTGTLQSGGEFGVFSATATKGTGLPGRFGVDFAFINKVRFDINDMLAEDRSIHLLCRRPRLTLSLIKRKSTFSV